MPSLPFQLTATLTDRNGNPVANRLVSFTNTRTGDILTATTDSSGMVKVNAYNFTNEYLDGDSIKCSTYSDSTDFNVELIENTTGLRLQRPISTSGTGSYISRFDGMIVNDKIKIIISGTNRDFTGKMRIVYNG